MNTLIDLNGNPLVHGDRCICDEHILTWDETLEEYIDRVTSDLNGEDRRRYNASAAAVYDKAAYYVLARKRLAR